MPHHYIWKVFVLGVLFTLNLSCSDGSHNQKTKAKGYDTQLLDNTVAPCEDFFGYTANKWIEQNPIPETESKWGSFNILIEENNKRLRSIIKDCSTQSFEEGSPEQKIKDLYEAAMDSNAIDDLGIAPLKEDLAIIESMKSLEELPKVLAYLHQLGSSALFHFYSETDSRNATKNIASFWQGGLGLPDKTYYFSNKPRSEKTRQAYKLYMRRILELSKTQEDLDEAVTKIYGIEESLAKISKSRKENRDPQATYNKMSKSDIKVLTPESFNMSVYYDLVGAPEFDSAVVGQPGFFVGLEEIIPSKPLEDWKLYLRWNLIREMSQHLPKEFVQVSFDFHGKAMRGKKKNNPRWKRSLGFINANVGELLGQIYVKKYFQEDKKQKINIMVENLRTAFSARVHQLDWMSETTKKKALEKLKTFNKKIGYPDKWKDYSALKIKAGGHIENVKAIRRFAHLENMKEIESDVDKDKWFMAPQTVNAYYSPTKNEIVFPAAILSAPFFEQEADDAINYGGIGVVIGHEFTHGFDDQGSQYDKDGNLNNWWTIEDSSKFAKKTDVLVNQFNSMTPLEGYNVDGRLTLGENIADLGGLIMAFNAMKESFGGETPEKIDGFTAEQRFFLGYARLWRSAITDEALIERISTDPHSPARARVNGPLKNLKIFQDAWGCNLESEMVLEDSAKAKIW